jgi:hypothetical protein
MIGLVVGLLTLSTGALANASSLDRTSAIAQLESREDQLTRELVMPPKKGVAQRSEIRSQRSAVQDEIERLAAGASPDASRMASLMDESVTPDADDSRALANLASSRQKAFERKLVAGPKIGLARESQIRREINDLDSMIAALERGEDVDIARMNDALGMMIARAPLTPEQRLQESKYELASLKRKLLAGPRIGAVTRGKIRDEIEMLDTMIEQLESQQAR